MVSDSSMESQKRMDNRTMHLPSNYSYCPDRRPDRLKSDAADSIVQFRGASENEEIGRKPSVALHASVPEVVQVKQLRAPDIGSLPVVALDGDGVLLDYNGAYPRAWSKAFGVTPTLLHPEAYWPMARWGVPELTGSKLEDLRATFDQDFWSTIEPMPGALHACEQLVNAGFDLVCVTALDDRFAQARADNLRHFGFPISRVVATGNDASVQSPKAKAVASLNAVAFVDDFAPYLVGVDSNTHRGLITRDPVGSPNVGDLLHHADSTHPNLSAVAIWWIGNFKG